MLIFDVLSVAICASTTSLPLAVATAVMLAPGSCLIRRPLQLRCTVASWWDLWSKVHSCRAAASLSQPLFLR